MNTIWDDYDYILEVVKKSYTLLVSLNTSEYITSSHVISWKIVSRHL